MTRGQRTARAYRQAARARARDERRWRILQAAWDLFAERRYDEISVAEVAARAGVSERTVYRLTGPKERLLDSWERDAAAERAVWERGEDPSRPWALRIGWQRWLDEERRPLPAGDVAVFVDGTLRFHDQWGDALMNLRRQVDDVAQFAAFLDYSRRRHRDNVDHLLGPLIDALPRSVRQMRREGLYAVSDFPMWHSLRREARLEPARTQQVLLDLVTCLLGPARRKARRPTEGASRAHPGQTGQST